MEKFDQSYIEMAGVWARNSYCKRRQVGALIVKDRMIISDGYPAGNSEYGAIYDDRISISNIRSDFEKTWNIASNLDENVILNSIGGAA